MTPCAYPREPDPETPADLVIRVFGGVRAAARACGRDPSTVSRWQRDGMVPADVQGVFLDLAEALILPIRADDLIMRRRAPREVRDGRR